MAYSKQYYSGICVCTHPFKRHHISLVGNPEYYAATGETQIADSCLWYGFNEAQDAHCPGYHDRDDPQPDPYAELRAEDPSVEVRRLRNA